MSAFRISFKVRKIREQLPLTWIWSYHNYLIASTMLSLLKKLLVLLNKSKEQSARSFLDFLLYPVSAFSAWGICLSISCPLYTAGIAFLCYISVVLGDWAVIFSFYNLPIDYYIESMWIISWLASEFMFEVIVSYLSLQVFLFCNCCMPVKISLSFWYYSRGKLPEDRDLKKCFINRYIPPHAMLLAFCWTNEKVLLLV